MTNIQKDSLFTLIKSLSKSEKRQFKLYVGRLGGNTDSKFLALFNFLDKAKKYDEATILASGIVKKQQLSNLKAHLYKQILVSLRLNPAHHNVRVMLREQLDFATILYNKGLYKQSLKILDKAKTLAIQNEEKNVAYEIVEFEKIIETQYITRSISNRADELAVEAKRLSVQNVLASKLSNLSLMLYGLLLRFGYVKNDAEHKEVSKYFHDRLPEYFVEDLGFREKLWLYKSYLWFSFLTQDFLSCYKYSKKLVDNFYENPKKIQLHPVFFLKSNNYLLESLYYLKYATKYKASVAALEETIASKSFPQDDNIQALNFLYSYSNKLNLHFMEGTFEAALPLEQEILSGLETYRSRIDEHHVMVLYYKIASLHFGAGDNKQCIAYLQKIINNKSLSMREDLLCFSRVLNLVAHYEAGLDYNLELHIRNTYKFLIKMDDLHEVQKEMIKFLRNLGEIYPSELKQEFKKLHARLKSYEDHPYERRAFLYLDILSWLESKIENKPVATIIQQKAKLLNR